MEMQMWKCGLNFGLERLLLVLCLMATWEAQAVLDSVPPKIAFPAGAPALHNLDQYTGCSLMPNGGVAINDYPSDMFYTVILYNNPSDAQNYVHPGMFSNNCVPRNMGGGVTQYGILIVQSAECPKPKLYPSISYKFNYSNHQCEREIPGVYTLALTPGTSTIEPGKSTTLDVEVTQEGSGAPSIQVPVTLKVEVDATSGGHDHGETVAPRPKGSLSTTSGMTKFPVIFTAEEISGKHTITATCDLCSNSPKTATVEVKVDGLWPIWAAPKLYAFIGGESDKQHHDNHYLTSAAFNQLTVIAINYHFLYPNDPILHLNDASLKWGGKFDIKGTWKGDHQGHKRGTVIDIRANSINEGTSSIPERLFAKFEKVASETKKILPRGEVSANAKLHCSRGRDPAVDNCVGDDNRHYHVILLGVDQ